MLTDMYVPNYKYMFVYIYIYILYWNRFLPFFGPWNISLHDLPGAPTKVMGVSGWMNVMSEGGGISGEITGGHWPVNW